MTDIELAKECGALNSYFGPSGYGEPTVQFTHAALTAFADRIRAEERERCATICDDLELKLWNDYKGRPWGKPHPERKGNPQVEGMSDGAGQCSAAIRGMK